MQTEKKKTAKRMLVLHRFLRIWQTAGWLFAAFVPVTAAEAQSKAQTRETLTVVKYDTNYIDNHRNLLCVNLVNTLRDVEVGITNPANTEEVIRYGTNNYQNWGIGASYKWLSFEFTTKVPFLTPLDTRKGNTYPFGLRLGINGRKIWFTSFLQSYQGMYMDNAQLLDNQWFSKHVYYPVRPDLTNQTLYATINYAFNHRRFSQNAALWQIDQQKRSAGTFIVGLSSALYGITADSSVVPRALQPRFDRTANVIASGTFYLGLNAGYLHTFVIKQRGFIHLGLIPSFGIQGRGYQLSDGTQVGRSELAVTAEVRISLGYNGKTYYAGLAVSNIAFADNASLGGVVSITHSYVRLFFGRRFRLGFRVPLIDRK